MADTGKTLSTLLNATRSGRRIEAGEALALLPEASPEALMPIAEALTLEGFGTPISYSRKVFIPLTQLCRDVCHYCTFAKAPRRIASAYLSADEVLAIARAGAALDCKEALFTLGDKPEARYAAARTALAELGAASTLEYLQRMARLVLEQSGLLPHLNPGVMSREELQQLRPVSASMGLMLESAAERLCERGGPHFGSPDKRPALRLATLRAAGELAIPVTSGLLIGIGETRAERLESLLALRELHDAHGHVQEIIIQNFKPKPGTKMARAPEAPLAEELWSIAAARLLFGPTMSIQAPPNLQPEGLASLVRAGINDWGGVSPVTPDHVNPEAPWPQLQELSRASRAAGRELVERLALVPRYAAQAQRWTHADITSRVRRLCDSRGFARPDRWFAGAGSELPTQAERWGQRHAVGAVGARIASILAAARAGATLAEGDIVRLFAAEGAELEAVIEAADDLRREAAGETVTYVVNRNINYTNICLYHCGFCAFSKGRGSRDLRGPAYNLDLEEIARRTSEAADAGATEVCLQGGIHPSYTGQTYLSIVRAVREAVPWMHVHAFSALEIQHGATTLGLSLARYLEQLRDAGLSTLPGTAAEILDDEIRAIICPDKLTTDQWLQIVGTAHAVGLRSTATIMFGHVESAAHWARHLLRVRALQARTGGFTEFVPLGFVHMEAPLWRRGATRSGPTFREAVLMHAVARLALHPLIAHIQTSWVKMGARGAAVCLRAGANDLGGTLMNESITRAAGGVHGQLMDAAQLQGLAAALGRPARQRTTLYGQPGSAPVSLATSLTATA
ncbi:MAG TPA: 5-amino-6-(D-ribitylamino)uracil--L-tyrosine 4-hydroxyphenyl transferase CofH [Steroidobacteraceae bacterium]|jgi:FO synthase|nr:5-amino-6-(D-ribitylamino)uracil--L-tyrosine 4-hydroxyphenyl transferase CofH [Steroidobacteraceae bacterium]